MSRWRELAVEVQDLRVLVLLVAVAATGARLVGILVGSR